MTVKNYGESPTGTWTLTLSDRSEGNLGDCVDLEYLLVIDLEDGSTGIADCKSFEAALICSDGTVYDEQVDQAIDDINGHSGKPVFGMCKCLFL